MERSRVRSLKHSGVYGGRRALAWQLLSRCDYFTRSRLRDYQAARSRPLQALRNAAVDRHFRRQAASAASSDADAGTW